ncbi:hypothetical protein [Nocardia abscessus]|uniref:hypothetical protein n=1 Tax=Nocardia abscessus TaxID=120957 RepID=UPI0002FE0364|nr:hypothetical protein [Nocardia abscessus]MCC3331012.1 hypothetical protein [Nocardia abscessus]
MSTHRPSRPAALRRVVTLVAGAVAAGAGLLWLRCIYLVVAFRLVTDPAFDPHGYGLIAGTVLSVPAALVTAVAVAFAFPARHRVRVARITTPVLLVITTLLWAAFLTA